MSAAALPSSLCVKPDRRAEPRQTTVASAARKEMAASLDTNLSDGNVDHPVPLSGAEASKNGNGCMKVTASDDLTVADKAPSAFVTVQVMTWQQALVVIQLAYKARLRQASQGPLAGHRPHCQHHPDDPTQSVLGI